MPWELAGGRTRTVTEVTEYLVNSTAWSIGGLVVGYSLGRIESDIGEIKRILRSLLRKDHRDDS